MHLARPNHRFGVQKVTPSSVAILLAIALLGALAVATVTAPPAYALSLLATHPHVTRAPRSAGSIRMPADTGETATVTGTVYDSVSRSPLGGADVQLVDLDNRARAYAAHADSLGRFRVDSMRPGHYVAGFFHPSLDAFGIEPPLQGVTVHAGADNFITLVIPGPVLIMATLCGNRLAADSTGAMVGAVRDAESRLPIVGAKVVVSWFEVTIDKRGLVKQQRRVPIQTDENGSYRLCGLPGADTVLANAEAKSRRSGIVSVPVPIRGIARRDFTLGDSTSAITVAIDSNADADVRRETTLQHGSAKLAGLVSGPDGRPMSGARVVVWGTGLEATTRSDGRFNLGGLPAGTFSVEARMLGFEPRRVSVDLSARTPVSVGITFKGHLEELSRVVVLGKASRRPHDIYGFLGRSRAGMGHFITAADNSLKTAAGITDALRTVAGVHVLPSGFGHLVLLRGLCAPTVYVDGMQATDGYKSLDDIVSPREVAGIEVYSGLGEGPPQYRSNGCGAILIWTKR